MISRLICLILLERVRIEMMLWLVGKLHTRLDHLVTLILRLLNVEHVRLHRIHGIHEVNCPRSDCPRWVLSSGILIVRWRERGHPLLARAGHS